MGRKGEEMDRYIRFSPEAFLKDVLRWEEELKELEAKLEEISELPAITNSEVHTTNISDPTHKQAVKRAFILDQIERVKKYIQAYERIYAKLTDFEKEVLTGFFFSSNRIDIFVEEFGHKYALCRSDVYKARRRALDHFGELLTARYDV